MTLRQAWAMRFMQKDIQDKVIINIDETWLGATDYRRMMWGVRGTSNSLQKKQLTPRISMIVAIDTSGNSYFTLN